MASAAGRRLFKHLTWLTLLLGMLVGIWIVVLGVAFHDLAPTPLRAVKLASPLVDELLVPLSIFLDGAIMSTILWREQLRAQLQVIWQPTQNKKAPLSLSLLVTGVYFMSFGVFLLIDRAFDYSLDIIMLLLVAGYFGALLWTYWYTWRRDRRLRAQP